MVNGERGQIRFDDGMNDSAQTASGSEHRDDSADLCEGWRAFEL